MELNSNPITIRSKPSIGKKKKRRGGRNDLSVYQTHLNIVMAPRQCGIYSSIINRIQDGYIYIYTYIYIERERERCRFYTSNKRLEEFLSHIILLIRILKSQTKFIVLQSLYFVHWRKKKIGPRLLYTMFSQKKILVFLK